MENKNKLFYKEYKRCFSPFIQLYPLAMSSGLYESGHIADGMEESATIIANIIKNYVIECLDSGQFEEKEIFTNLYFDKDYKNHLINGIKNGILVNPISDENNGYPIYLIIENKQETNTITAQVPWRNKTDDTFENIFIKCNVYNYIEGDVDINGFGKYALLVSTISHELQHIFDMYILPHCNPFDTNRKIGSVVSLSEDIFHIKSNKNLYGILNRLLTMMAHEEQRARLAELKSVIEIISANKDLANEMFYESFMYNLTKDKTKYVSNETVILESTLLRRVGSDKIFQIVTRVDLFYNDIKTLLQHKVNYPLVYNAIMLIFGYYMFKHNLIRLPLDNNEKKIIKKCLSEDMIKKMVDFKTMTANIPHMFDFVIDTVFDSIRYRFGQYLGDVHNRISIHLPHLYNYKMVKEMFGYSEYDDEVVLYPL